MRGPMPAPARSPLRLRRCGGGLRGSRPGCGPRPGPLCGPGSGALAAARGPRPSPRLRQPPGGPRSGGGGSGRRRAGLAASCGPRPVVVASPLRAASGRPAGVVGPCASSRVRRARLGPPRVPPALPRPAGRGGPGGPPGLLHRRGRLGGVLRPPPKISRRPRRERGDNCLA